MRTKIYLNKEINLVQVYIDTLISVTVENKYRRTYLSIINKALERASSRESANKLLYYVEGHHILPKSFRLGGAVDSNNIVFLTPLEHYTVHVLLPKFVSKLEYTTNYRQN